jgi:hypothetical protein
MGLVESDVSLDFSRDIGSCSYWAQRASCQLTFAEAKTVSSMEC